MESGAVSRPGLLGSWATTAISARWASRSLSTLPRFAPEPLLRSTPIARERQVLAHDHGVDGSLGVADPAHLQRPQESHEIRFLLGCQLKSQNQVEELHRVVDAQEPAVVKVGRSVLDASV